MDSQEKVDEGPILALFSKRIQEKKKKIREIKTLEKKSKEGNTISPAEYKNMVDRKGRLIAELNELQNLKLLLPDAIKMELSSMIHYDSEGSKSDESSGDNESIIDDNKPAKVDPLESAKSCESGELSMAQSLAHPEVDQHIEKRYYRFMKRYKFDKEDEPFYHGDALALVSRRNFRVQYNDIYVHDKTLAMKICADYERLKPTLTEATKRFSREVLKKSIKSLTPRKANAASANVENLKLSIIGKPRSHQKLDTFLQPRSIVLEDVVVHSDTENPMKTPSVIGAALLMGVLEFLITKHLQGISCNGHLGIENVEVYDGDKYVITSPWVSYRLGSAEWVAACQKDFKSYAGSFVPLFQTDGKYPPHMDEFRESLLNVPLEVLQNRDECLAFHEFMLHHMTAKPIPVRAALVSGIHSCCKAYDLKDPAAPFKDIAYETELDLPKFGGFWTEAVGKSGNELMKKMLTKRLKNGVEIDCMFKNDLESMTTYLRILNYHGSDYTKERKKKNQGNSRNWRRNKSYQNKIQNPSGNKIQNPSGNQIQNPSGNQKRHNQNQKMSYLNIANASGNQIQNHSMNPNLNDASVSQELKVPDEPQVQRLKVLNELELIGARHLGPYVLHMIYTLLRRKAMTGMLLPVWKSFKSCKLQRT